MRALDLIKEAPWFVGITVIATLLIVFIVVIYGEKISHFLSKCDKSAGGFVKRFEARLHGFISNCIARKIMGSLSAVFAVWFMWLGTSAFVGLTGDWSNYPPPGEMIKLVIIWGFYVVVFMGYFALGLHLLTTKAKSEVKDEKPV